MGLDGVELVMAFESEFGVTIPDAAAESMRTPRDVIDFITTKPGSSRREICLSRRAFHTVRRTLMQAGHSRRTIRPAAPLDEFFPVAHRNDAWPRLRGEFTTSQWPDLNRPAWLIGLLIVSIAAVVVALATIVAQGSEWGIGVLAGCFALAFLCPVAESLTRPLCTLFPGMNTIGDLSSRIADRGISGLLKTGEDPARDDVAAIVRAIIIEHLGIDPSAYGEDKDFIRDFGMD